MNILFLTLTNIKSIEDNSIYMDLLNEFVADGDRVCVVSPLEKRENTDSYTMEKPGMRIIKARTGNLFNVGMIEKGISQVMLSRNYTKAINRFTDKTERCDLILYSTPPITLTSVVAREKRRNNAVTYLMLKDVFPRMPLISGSCQNPA